MATNLILGVINVPYDNGGKSSGRKVPKKPRSGKKAPPTTKSRSTEPTDTATVATILEDKYGVMGLFAENHKEQITGALVDSLKGALEDLFAGSPVKNPYAGAQDQIAADFRNWLMTGQIEQLGVAGVPTQAAIDRRSLRFKNKKSAGPRPSFIDTGAYEGSFRAWVE